MPRSKKRPRSRGHYRIMLLDVVAAHEVAMRYGGLPGIRSEAEILSAIGRPYIGYYRPIHRKAAALFQSLATNHGFNDGNKRTAVLMTVGLIDWSGYDLVPIQPEHLGTALRDLALHVVNDKPSIDEIAEWFRLRVRRK